MGVQLTKELVRVDQVVGEDKAQSVVEGIITLPNGKPDIQQVISVDATLDTESLETDIIENKVIVEGKIDVNAMYVGAVPEGTQPVHFVEGTVDFSFFVKIPGAKKNMDVRVKAKIEHIQFSFDPNRPREIKVRIIVEFFVKVTKRVEIEIVVDATGPADLQVLKKSLRIEDVVGEASAQNIVKSDVSVPDNKPDILEIIKVEGKARETETKIIDDKIIIEGVLEVSVLYAASVPAGEFQQPVHFMEVEVPFTQFVEIPGAKEGMAKLVKVEVEHIRGRRKDARTVTVEAILKIKAKVFETKILNVVVDVFSPSEKLEVEKTLLKVDQVIGEAENEIVVKEVLTVPDEKPPIEQIYRTKAKATVTESRIIDDKVIVEGTLTLETLYVADVTGIPGAPLQPLHFMEHEVPFTTFVEIPGAKENMTLDFDVNVEHVSSKVDPNDPRRFEVRAVLGLRAKVTQMVQIEVVVNVVEPEEEEKEEEKKEKEKKEEEKPSMTIYIVQKGDTLWNIAKRYNVTVDSIVKANNIANPDSIMPGQQLVIPRRMT
jgi:spore coat assembly protein SafA